MTRFALKRSLVICFLPVAILAVCPLSITTCLAQSPPGGIEAIDAFLKQLANPSQRDADKNDADKNDASKQRSSGARSTANEPKQEAIERFLKTLESNADAPNDSPADANALARLALSAEIEQMVKAFGIPVKDHGEPPSPALPSASSPSASSPSPAPPGEQALSSAGQDTSDGKPSVTRANDKSGAKDKSDEGRAARKPSERKRTELQSDYEQALKLARLEQRPLLALLGAPWCGWCDKLEADLAQPEADSILKEWIVVKINVDQSPELATKLQVGALPGLRVIGPDQSIVASTEGYQPLDKLKQWLDQNVSQANPELHRVLFATDVPDDDSLQRLIAFLNERNPQLRMTAQARLFQSQSVARGAVVDVLRNGSLSQRLCAQQILIKWNAPVADIDPWQPDSINPGSVAPLVDWLRAAENETGHVASAPAPASDKDRDDNMDAPGVAGAADGKGVTGASPSQFKDLINDILKSPELRRSSLMTQAVEAGIELAPEIRSRLSEASVLDDHQKRILRELLYRVLAGPQLRLRHATLLVALADLDQDTHRDAADRVLSVTTSADQPLIDELARDTDALVRELSVARLQRIGALQSPQRLAELLDDPSPSVRTAVLKEVAHDPKPQTIAALVDYLNRESNEDLLVFATKTLGDLASNSKAQKALIQLTSNPSWRVRAAALDSIASYLQNATRFSHLQRKSNSDRQAVIDSVLDCLDDDDEFVAQRAAGLLPYVITKQSAPVVASYIEQHPKRLHEILEDVSEYSRETLLEPLIDQAVSWLEMNDPAHVGGAAHILSELAPEQMIDHIPRLLARPEAPLRLSALRAIVTSAKLHRDTSLADLSEQWLLAQSSLGNYPVPHPPWHTVPDWFKPAAKTTGKRIRVADSVDHSALPSDPESEPNETKIDKDLHVADDWFEGMVDARSSSADDSDGADDSDDAEGADDASTKEADVAESPLWELVQAMMAQPTTESSNADGDDGSNEKRSASDTAAGQNRKGKNRQRPVAENPVAARPSQWLAAWIQHDNDASIPAWREELESAIKQSIQNPLPSPAPQSDAADQRLVMLEKIWQQVALLALGSLSSEQMETLVASVRDAQQKSSDDEASELPSLVDLLPWLPSKQRIDVLMQSSIDWHDLTHKETYRLLEAATEFDSLEVAQWLYSKFDEMDLSLDKQRAAAQALLMGSLLGKTHEGEFHFMDDNPKNYAGKKFVDEPIRYHPAGTQATEWLSQKYADETRAEVKAVLLATVAPINHRLATESAVGLILSSTQDGPDVQVALHIALADHRQLAIDRAVQFLDLKAPFIRLGAIERLATDGPSYAYKYNETHLGGVIEYNDNRPGFLYAARPISKEIIEQSLLESQSPDSRANVRLLAVACGDRDQDLDELAKDLSLSAPGAAVCAALAKAGRSDPSAIAFYQRYIEHGNPDQEYQDEDDAKEYKPWRGREVYSMVRELNDAAIIEFRKQLRATFGTDVLDPNMN